MSQLVESRRVRLVTLATPFLRVFARPGFALPFIVRWLLWVGVWGIAAPLVMIIIMSTLSATAGLTGWPVTGRSTYWILLTGAAMAGVAGIFVVRGLIAFLVNPRPTSPSGGTNNALAIQKAASYPAVGGSSPPILVVRGVDDEASLALAAGSIGSRVSSVFLFILIPVVLNFGLLVLLLLGRFGGSLVAERIDPLSLWLTNACVLGALALVFLPGTCKAVFGREFFRTAFVCEIAADSAPDLSARADVVTLSPVGTKRTLRLRHYIYDHLECVNTIVRWMRDSMRS
jgi:hypothetical protein